jgi:hypothetical protein
MMDNLHRKKLSKWQKKRCKQNRKMSLSDVEQNVATLCSLYSLTRASKGGETTKAHRHVTSGYRYLTLPNLMEASCIRHDSNTREEVSLHPWSESVSTRSDRRALPSTRPPHEAGNAQRTFCSVLQTLSVAED